MDIPLVVRVVLRHLEVQVQEVHQAQLIQGQVAAVVAVLAHI